MGSKDNEPLMVTVISKYVERPDGVYYLWHLQGEEGWHEKPTALKETPYFHMQHYRPFEWQEKEKKLLGEDEEHIAPGRPLTTQDLTNLINEFVIFAKQTESTENVIDEVSVKNFGIWLRKEKMKGESKGA